MANNSWDISIQVLDETLHHQVDPSHANMPIHVTEVVQQSSLSSTQIGQFEIINIVKMGECVKVEDSLSKAEIKTWVPLSNLCRLCAQESEDSVKIFGDEGIALHLPEIISVCLPITVKPEDALPQVICRTCVFALQHSHILLNTVKEADTNLRKMLVQQSIESGDLLNKDCESNITKSFCNLCKQQYLQLNEEPHVITISSVVGNAAQHISTNELSQMNFADTANNDDDSRIFDDCSDLATSESISAEEPIKPNRKYNTRRVEEPTVLKESKLRPRKKGKALTKRSPPKERLPLPEIHCNKCSGIFHKKDQYLKHYLLQHKLYLCSDCDQSFERHEELSGHSFEVHNAVIPPERYHHPPGTLPICTFCCKKFKSISGLCHHVDSLHLKIPGNFLCNQCGKPFYGKKKLELHMMRHTGIKTVMCQDCGKMFYNESTLKIHSEMHSVQRKYKCSHVECDKTFKHWRNLYAHMHTVHGRKWNYACTVCPQSFKTAAEAAEHYKLHSAEERDSNESGVAYTKMSPFECRICFKHYNSQLHYSNHMKTHENPSATDSDSRNHECPTCSKRFKSKHYLKIHLGVHMTMKPFCCQYCGKSFITKMLLQTHERIHTNETPFRCEICGKGFRAQKKLQIHKRDVHDKIKNFLCLTCGKAFSRKNHLDAHIRTHTNERPYQCDICGQGFKQVGDMRRHVARHQNHPQPLYKPPSKHEQI